MFNIQEKISLCVRTHVYESALLFKITVYFHTRVYVHTGQKTMTILYVGFLGRGQQSPLGAPPQQLEGLGSAVSSPSGVRGGAPATNRFFAFWCVQNGSPTQHEAPKHA